MDEEAGHLGGDEDGDEAHRVAAPAPLGPEVGLVLQEADQLLGRQLRPEVKCSIIKLYLGQKQTIAQIGSVSEKVRVGSKVCGLRSWEPPKSG